MTAGAKVLIVDDDAAFRSSTFERLSANGYAPLEADSADEARVVLADDPDVAAVLCDITMPGTSGLELLEYLEFEFPDLAVVMTTSIASPEVADSAFGSGAFGYLVKPISTTELLIGLRGALRRRELEMMRRRHLGALEETVSRTKTLDALLESLDDGLHSEEQSDTLIRNLAGALAPFDERKTGHIERMSRYAVLLADKVGVSRPAGELRLAAALHDVGKIGVAEEILAKPGALTDSERSAMRRHARIGYRLLSAPGVPVLRLAADIAWSHHEWWDGSGYPRGLRGEEVSLEARVVAVVDVFDALTHEQVYRPALTHDDAFALMDGLRGRQFEPALLDAFLSVTDDLLAIRDSGSGREGDVPVRVLVVDDHEIFSRSLVRLLKDTPDVEVVGRAAGATEALALTAALRPDVVLMDYEMPDGDGPLATEQLKALMPAAKVVMLTMRTDDHARARALAAGCSGFVKKDQPLEDLLSTIAAVHDGEMTTAASELALLLSQLEPTRRGLGSDITPRELEVLQAMAAGLVNKEIAQQLGVRLNTVRNHVQNILYKLEVHSQLEAVATAVREGLVAASVR